MAEAHIRIGDDDERGRFIQIDIARQPLWRAMLSARAFRRFKFQWILFITYVLFEAGIFIFVLDLSKVAVLAQVLTSIVMATFLFTIMYSAADAHRRGFARGTEAIVRGMQLNNPFRAAELAMRTMDIWDPPPKEVAMEMSIAEVEKHANDPEGKRKE